MIKDAGIKGSPYAGRKSASLQAVVCPRIAREKKTVPMAS